MGTQTTTSNAFETFKRNLEYIDHLLNAREALLKFEQIKPKIDLLNESSNTKGLGGISKIVDKASEILNNIDSEPSRGKREFSPINISAYTLLVSIFQGFIDNLYYEKGKAKLGNLSEDEKYKILKDMKPQRVNPHYDVIQKMFCKQKYF